LTSAAQTLVSEEILRTLSGNPVFNDGPVSLYDMEHIRLAEWADLFLIAPGTANTIAKIANGLADNLLTSLALAFERPLLIAPAMNSAMWRNPATQRNLATCRENGVRLLPVGQGELACGTEGPGRMLEPETIVEYVLGAALPQSLRGKKVLISSGPTVEPLDPVRVITNLSSGAMGAALAQAALCMGADVTVVSGPATVRLPQGCRVIDITTASQMATALETEFEQTDICIMAAAVSDFKAAEVATSKISREKSGALHLTLVPNEDIAASLGGRKKGQLLVGFALESDEGLDRAVEKMRRKRCDLMVLNGVATSLGLSTSQITILSPDGAPQSFPSMSKREAAQLILQAIARKAGPADE
jgi:phosphopantothenoylcysteine decarboxylase/phosphopantothenate--cysteine ligase